MLKRGFKLALEDSRLTKMPPIKLLPETNVRQGFATVEQFNTIFTHLKSELMRDLAIFWFNSGWRLQEALKLEWRLIDLKEGTLSLAGIDTKTGKPRKMRLGAELLAALKRRAEFRRLDTRAVFHINGKVPHPKSMSRAWRKAAELAKLPITIHDLRRTVARDMIRSGTPERVVMTQLGHKTRSMLDRYNITSDDDLALAQSRLSEYRKNVPVLCPTDAAKDRTEG